ncbi:MAG: BamA/TamA family outer membrane protein [Bacteroidales bacterium]|nr:BamA/TamA family outer membrane protein [Bacteroidales bacterium]
MKAIFSRKSLLFLLLQLSCITGMSQIKDFLPLRLSDKLSILPSPSLSYRPETSWSMGAAIITTYNPNPDKALNISTAQLDLVYTLHKQFIADLDYSVYFNDDQWIASGSNSYYDYPEYYYGITSSYPEPLKELINSKRLEFDNRIYHQFRDHWYAGMNHRLQYITDLHAPMGGLFSKDWQTANQTGIEHGIGLGLVYDSRENQLNPIVGSTYFAASITSFWHFLRSKSKFERFELDYRRYFKLSTQQTLAFQAYGIANTGNPPYRLTGMLGGSRQMRGYYYGRYRNRQYLTLQSELRIHVYNRFGMVIFASLGNTAYKLNELIEHPPLTAYGAGLRFMLDKKNRANLRVDYAIGRNTSGWYISYGEAF